MSTDPTRTNAKMLFSLQGVDLQDDAALEAFAQYVWQQALQQAQHNPATDTDEGETA